LKKYHLCSLLFNPIFINTIYITMLRFYSLLFFCSLFQGLYAQGFSSCQVVIGASGGKSIENGRRYAYTVGEAITGTLISPTSGRVLTQGFHQPDVCLPVSTLQPDLWLNWEIQAYPNPTIDYLQLNFSAPDVSTLEYQVVDYLGRQVQSNAVLSTAGDRIDCSKLLAGTYLLVLRHPKTQGLLSIPFQKL
jgi:hypothetical protein